MDNFQKSLFNSARFYKKCCCMWVFGCTYIRTSCWNRYFEHKGVKSWSFWSILLLLIFFFKAKWSFSKLGHGNAISLGVLPLSPPSWICHTKSELDSVPSLVRSKHTTIYQCKQTSCTSGLSRDSQDAVHGKISCPKSEEDTQTPQLPCFSSWSVACWFVNRAGTVCMCLCQGFCLWLGSLFPFQKK